MLNTRIDELAAACDSGSMKVCVGNQREYFTEALLVQLKGAFSAADVDAIRRLIAEGHDALLAARRGKRAVADRGLTAAKSLLQLATSTGARRAAISFLSAQEAYFRYLDGDFRDAVTFLERAFCYDCMLEQGAGLPVLVMHRVQLLHNLMRIAHRRGLPQQALFLGCRSLDYLESCGGSALDRLPEPWCRQWPRHLSGVPVELLNQMHGQIAAEQIRACASLAASTDRSRIDDVLHEVKYGDKSQIALWVEVQIRWLKKEFEQGHEAMVELLCRGPCPSLPLWHSAAALVQQMLAEYDEAAVKQSRDEPRFQPSA